MFLELCMSLLWGTSWKTSAFTKGIGSNFDRNRDGPYCGLPKARNNTSAGPVSMQILLTVDLGRIGVLMTSVE
jgi:hypothetical protein